MSVSHFQGARRVPSTTDGDSAFGSARVGRADGSDGEDASSVRASASAPGSGSSGGDSTAVNPENRSSAGGGIADAAAGEASGTCERERYSANRAADSRSTAHPRSARNARPDGCGRPRPAIEPAWNPGTRERMTEQADVVARSIARKPPFRRTEHPNALRPESAGRSRRTPGLRPERRRSARRRAPGVRVAGGSRRRTA